MNVECTILCDIISWIIITLLKYSWCRVTVLTVSEIISGLLSHCWSIQWEKAIRCAKSPFCSACTRVKWYECIVLSPRMQRIVLALRHPAKITLANEPRNVINIIYDETSLTNTTTILSPRLKEIIFQKIFFSYIVKLIRILCRNSGWDIDLYSNEQFLLQILKARYSRFVQATVVTD